MSSLALLVTGAAGQVGSDLLRVAAHRRDVAFCRGLSRSDLDITDGAAVEDALAEWSRVVRSDGSHRPVVINAAAWTDVDGAEAEEVAAYAVNAAAPAHLAAACTRLDVELIHVSTDYVFAGDAGQPYEVDSAVGPRSAYGRTKLAGEEAVAELALRSWIVRTAWVYGETGQNFVKTMARLESQRDTIDVVDDQRGSPTWSRDLAAGLLALAGSQARYGVLHATGSGETTWCGLARAVFVEVGADPERVRPTTTDRFPRPAPRPAYSVLSGAAWQRAGLAPLPDWRTALTAAFTECGPALTAPQDAPSG